MLEDLGVALGGEVAVLATGRADELPNYATLTPPQARIELMLSLMTTD